MLASIIIEESNEFNDIIFDLIDQRSLASPGFLKFFYRKK
jgi:hypothetical protein